MQRKENLVALVSNAGDFAGPPGVDALAGAGFRVLVGGKALADRAAWAQFSAQHPSAEYVAAHTPASLVSKAWELAGKVDVIVSNDHFPATREPTETVSLANLRETLEALVVGPFEFVQAAIPRLKAQGGGSIIMITSCRTELPIEGGAIPDAARAAANALMCSWATELARFEISVNAIAPNFLYSEAYYPRAAFIDDPRGKAFVEAAVPAGRLGRPEEIGDVIRFLATTQARFLTGAVIKFAGGWPRGIAHLS